MIIIPARLNSTRFSQKILTPIDGVPMFVKTAQLALSVDECVVGVDDEKVLQIAKSYNLNAILTSKNHSSGTARLVECVQKLDLSDEIIVNLQADEPFFEKENLKAFLEFSKKHLKNNAFMCSCYKKSKTPLDENAVKCVIDKNDNAMYFSRSKIPFYRDLNANESYNIHIGIYSYTKASLLEFSTLFSTLDKIESLEQLKALENGKIIKMLQINTNSIGIDTKKDLENALSTIKP